MKVEKFLATRHKRGAMRRQVPRVACLGLALACGAALADQGPLQGAIAATKPLLDLRLRYETVSQDPFARDANALTVRARLGFQTGKAWGTALLADGDFIQPLVSDYNSTTNGKTSYPVVADPKGYELNRLQLTNTSLTDTTITIGRQRILLDDQRFVGNVGWRQNEQTYDGVRVVNKHVKNLTVDVTYLNRVNRVFGPKGLPGPNAGHFTGDTFLANVAWQSPVGKLTAFGYLIEFEQQPAPIQNTTQTYGLRLQGDRPLGKVKLAYVASWATQKNWRDNPVQFSDDYWLAELTGSYRMVSLGAGYEVLQGDGVKGFTTPLATLHKFQGWADKFLGTPANGLDDFYLNLGCSRKAVGVLDSLALAASWHDYQSGRASIDYGSELDLQLTGRYKRFTGILKYAAYNAKAATPVAFQDTDKFWAELDFTW